jgi:hypothetical protein
MSAYGERMDLGFEVELGFGALVTVGAGHVSARGDTGGFVKRAVAVSLGNARR